MKRDWLGLIFYLVAIAGSLAAGYSFGRTDERLSRDAIACAPLIDTVFVLRRR